MDEILRTNATSTSFFQEFFYSSQHTAVFLLTARENVRTRCNMKDVHCTKPRIWREVVKLLVVLLCEIRRRNTDSWCLSTSLS
jgi:hypothetical protein